MERGTPRSTRTDTLVPYQTLCRSSRAAPRGTARPRRAQAAAARPPSERQRRQRGRARTPGCRAGAGRAAEPAGRTAVLRLRRSEEHTSEPVTNAHLVCRLLLEKKNTTKTQT